MKFDYTVDSKELFQCRQRYELPLGQLVKGYTIEGASQGIQASLTGLHGNQCLSYLVLARIQIHILIQEAQSCLCLINKLYIIIWGGKIYLPTRATSLDVLRHLARFHNH